MIFEVNLKNTELHQAQAGAPHVDGTTVSHIITRNSCHAHSRHVTGKRTKRARDVAEINAELAGDADRVPAVQRYQNQYM
jgi:hypothetical protein